MFPVWFTLPVYCEWDLGIALRFLLPSVPHLNPLPSLVVFAHQAYACSPEAMPRPPSGPQVYGDPHILQGPSSQMSMACWVPLSPYHAAAHCKEPKWYHLCTNVRSGLSGLGPSMASRFPPHTPSSLPASQRGFQPYR